MLVVISPHLDDAVFSCGSWLATHPGSTVVTVFAGIPSGEQPRTDWDARCGFRDGATAVRRRHDEDRDALARLHARPRWLDFLDSQYGRTPAPDEISAALADVLDAVGAWATLLYPLGLFHSDHRLVHEAVRRLPRDAVSGRDLLAYEDSPYRGMTGVLQQRLAELQRQGVTATPARICGATVQADAAKAQAIEAYASQLRAFGAGSPADTAQPERFWRLEPPLWEAGA